jgi:hypothetical protein
MHNLIISNTIGGSPISGTGIDTTPTWPAVEAIGNIHADSSFPNLTPYTQTGSVFSVSGGALVMNTTAGTHANYLEINTANVQPTLANHTLEKWKMSISFVAPTASATTYGFGMGIKSNTTYAKVSTYIRLAFDTSAANGTIYVYSSINGAAPSQSVKTSTFTPVAATTYIFEVERLKNTLYARIKSSNGVTTHATYTHTFSIDFTTPQQYSANLGKFCIWGFGGNITMDNLVVSTDAQKNIDVLALGDSNMHGFYADSNSARYVEKACTDLGKSFEIIAGVDAGILDATPGIVPLFNPRIVYFNLGSNDEANGAADATWQARYVALLGSLASAGYGNTKVIIGIPTRRNGVDIPAIRTYLNANYTSFQRPDMYTATVSTGIEGDGVHMSPAGNALCEALLETAIDALL